MVNISNKDMVLASLSPVDTEPPITNNRTIHQKVFGEGKTYITFELDYTCNGYVSHM